jgi:hypothetical protein
MRFFVPTSNDSHHSEDLYQAIRNRVASENRALSERRIYQLKFRQDGHLQTAAVGSDAHGLGKGSVIAIFEGLDNRFWVCTHDGSDISQPEPHPVPASEIVATEDFSALA